MKRATTKSTAPSLAAEPTNSPLSATRTDDRPQPAASSSRQTPAPTSQPSALSPLDQPIIAQDSTASQRAASDSQSIPLSSSLRAATPNASLSRATPTPSRQSSIATQHRDISNSQEITPRAGRPALIVAAANHISTGPSLGKLPSRKSASVASNHGLPPTLRPPSPTFADPVITESTRINAQAGPSRTSTPAATPAPNDPASLAAAVLASIVPFPGSEPPPRLEKSKQSGQRQPQKRKSLDSAGAAIAGDKSAEVSAGWPERVAKERTGAAPTTAESASVRNMRRRPGLSTLNGNAEEAEDRRAEISVEDAEAQRIARKRGPYKTRTVAGTIYDRRLRANAHRRKKSSVLPPRTHPMLDGVQANDMVGEHVNPAVVTMKDLATDLISEGMVSSRGLKLHAFNRKEDERRRKERGARAELTWRRKQIQRRKMRAEHNTDRARRREQAGRMGDDEDAISVDSDDSAETFEPEPDRLTPPSSPDGLRRATPSGVASDQEEQVEGDDEQAIQLGEEDEADPERISERAAFQDTAAPPEIDEAEASLLAAGFTLADHPQLGVEDDENDEEIDEDIDWDVLQPDMNSLRADREEERRRIQEEMGQRVVIEEEDNETRMVNSATFAKKHSAAERWTRGETEFFYMVSHNESAEGWY